MWGKKWLKIKIKLRGIWKIKHGKTPRVTILTIIFDQGRNEIAQPPCCYALHLFSHAEPESPQRHAKPSQQEPVWAEDFWSWHHASSNLARFKRPQLFLYVLCISTGCKKVLQKRWIINNWLFLIASILASLAVAIPFTFKYVNKT